MLLATHRADSIKQFLMKYKQSDLELIHDRNLIYPEHQTKTGSRAGIISSTRKDVIYRYFSAGSATTDSVQAEPLSDG